MLLLAGILLFAKNRYTAESVDLGDIFNRNPSSDTKPQNQRNKIKKNFF